MLKKLYRGPRVVCLWLNKRSVATFSTFSEVDTTHMMHSSSLTSSGIMLLETTTWHCWDKLKVAEGKGYVMFFELPVSVCFK